MPKNTQTTSWPPAPPTTNLHVVVDQLLGSQKSSEKKKLTKLVFVGSIKEVLACFLCIFPRFWKKNMENQTQRMQEVTDVQSWRTEAWGPEPRVWEYCSRSDSWKSQKQKFPNPELNVHRCRLRSSEVNWLLQQFTIVYNLYVHIEIYPSIIWQIHISNQNRNQKMIYKICDWIYLNVYVFLTKNYVPCLYVYAWRHEEKASVRSHGCHPGRGMNLTNQRDTPGLETCRDTPEKTVKWRLFG